MLQKLVFHSTSYIYVNKQPVFKHELNQSDDESLNLENRWPIPSHNFKAIAVSSGEKISERKLIGLVKLIAQNATVPNIHVDTGNTKVNCNVLAY